MMNERRRKLQTVKVDHYDGQSIYSGNELIYELGGYLGGGAAGVVYEAFCMRTKQHVAIKILNPVGYKLLPSTLLSRCIVAIKGKPLDVVDDPPDEMMQPPYRNRNNVPHSPMRIENVWWLIHPTTKQAIAAFEDPRTGMVRELTLPQCIEIWGTEHATTENAMDTFQEVEVKNQVMKIPTIPKKFLKFAFTRRSIHREISNMSGLDFHENVLRLDEALELVQDSKCTTFLVLELAAGGELFDRIKLDCGTDEVTARRYFRQLTSGVAFCHTSEVLMDAGQGYDGAKADAWSIGVILYAMIAGNLPFGKDLLKCMRYDKFRKWSYNTKYSDDDPADEVVFPSWFFPQHFSLEVKSLIAQLLYPDPCMRLSVEEAQRHPWVLDQVLKKSNPSSINEEPQLSSPKAMPCHVPSYKTHSKVIVNIPQSTIDQEQRWGNTAAARSGMASPLGGFGRPIGLSICPPSPQKTPRPMHLASGGYMPSVDEESSPTAGQTPPTTPRARETSVSLADVDNVGSICSHQAETGLQFEEQEEHDEIQGQTLQSFTDLDAAAEVDEESEAFFSSTATSASPLPRSTSRDASRQFISPPIAIESRGNMMFNRRHQYRRNSPPELFLSRFGKAARFEEIRMLSLDKLDLSSPTSSLSSTPTGESAFLASPALDTAVKALASVDTPPPCNDHVARSTRFLTALPAQLVLSKIEVILASNPSPLPYPYKNVPQRVTIDWSNYQLEVHYGSILTCTVQVFLYQRGVYLVEFRRGQVEIFQFKRFYEDIREKISDSMETSEDASPSFIRKRNRSISSNAIF
uniref:non-specific serine/threonine protein kinase n=1 Tax=Globisporangium ultimum (strain ATCC 200006 / CBS 805.95 / DAOM BR144) TaxID=431595 RepID=K3WAL1_GLOUD